MLRAYIPYKPTTTIKRGIVVDTVIKTLHTFLSNTHQGALNGPICNMV
jgi:hypothetical protein